MRRVIETAATAADLPIERLVDANIERTDRARAAIVWVARRAHRSAWTIIARQLGVGPLAAIALNSRAERLRGTDPAFHAQSDALLALTLERTAA